jgi:hypothetical protein
MEDSQTIGEAKEMIFEEETFEKGSECPCCGQMVRLYKRQPYYAQAIALINLFNLDRNEPGYYHITNIEKGIKKSGGGDFAKLKVFGLIVEQENDNTKKRTSGMWAITDKGRKFALKQISIPKFARIYNKKYYDTSDEYVNITDLLGKEFDYRELMGDGFEEDEPIQGSLL